MSKLSRRNFLKAVGATGTAAGLTAAGCQGVKTGPAKVVVIGGGFGGATAAKYVKRFDPSIDVTLVEASKTYTTCPGSNWVIGGLRKIDSITHSYNNLKKFGIHVVHDWVTDIDANGQKVATKGGLSLAYDRLIVSPGIDFRWDEEGTHAGYTKNDVKKVPHAWQAGEQTTILRNQLEAMPDGGTFVIAPPPNPFRCPPGPGERISMVAHYFKQHKPNSKIIAIDGKGKFSKQGLFKQGWAELYGDMIDYRQNLNIESVDVNSKTVQTDVEAVKADVLNVIPAQKAGWIAHHAGLTDKSGWCPVDHLTWESTIHKNIHVIGDAAIQKPLPKSGYAANSEAKVCAASVVGMLNGGALNRPSWVNTCYSLVGPNYGISVAMVYDLKDGKVAKVKGSGGLSPKDGNRQLEAIYTENWYNNVVSDIWG